LTGKPRFSSFSRKITSGSGSDFRTFDPRISILVGIFSEIKEIPHLSLKVRNPGFSLGESKIRLTVEFYLGTLIIYVCGLFSLNSGVLPVFGL